MLFERRGTPTRPVAGHPLRVHLAAGVADEHDRAVLLEQAGDALVVAHAAVDEANADEVLVLSLPLVRIEAVENQRLEQAGHAGRSGDGMAETESAGTGRAHPCSTSVEADRCESISALIGVGGSPMKEAVNCQQWPVLSDVALRISAGTLFCAPPVVTPRDEIVSGVPSSFIGWM